MGRDKIKKIINSKITIGVICFCVGGAVMGGDSEAPIKESADSKEVVQQEEQEGSSNKPSQKEDVIKMELGKKYSIKTDSGEYNISIDGIRFTDKRNQFSEKKAKHVMFLDYSYENISSTNEVYIFSSNFKIMDSSGNILDSYPVSDDNRISKKLPIGGKCKATDAYALPDKSDTVKVLFYDNMFMKPIGQAEIKTNL
ncbi:DUF5067 domain-containing protein [Clostridium thermobutyricum]|uniref:Telomeric repeat-binding factor 2 n=1 Tax=Clostridium thermobutyricum DSM 4928 TaxID=1121339 RepID=A0A1V4SUV0_9CLOT|nr:DUF5067 domain-containing protein [Clostridium thermobutyricum]OPX47621.1 telomeric repeat-binding factor 2 [Clostridium thermobutyricum DSM 4928]